MFSRATVNSKCNAPYLVTFRSSSLLMRFCFRFVLSVPDFFALDTDIFAVTSNGKKDMLMSWIPFANSSHSRSETLERTVCFERRW